jgi:hypothetical protein
MSRNSSKKYRPLTSLTNLWGLTRKKLSLLAVGASALKEVSISGSFFSAKTVDKFEFGSTSGRSTWMAFPFAVVLWPDIVVCPARLDLLRASLFRVRATGTLAPLSTR